MLQSLSLVFLVLCWIAWATAFRSASKAVKRTYTIPVARPALLGIALEGLAYAVAWLNIRPAGFHKSAFELTASIVVAIPSVALAWAANRHMRKRERLRAAALQPAHSLIQTGPYAWLRHPVYASMFGMMMATALCWSWWPMFVIAVLLFAAGTEIRIWSEEKFLLEHFGDAYKEYQERTPAYLPFLR